MNIADLVGSVARERGADTAIIEHGVAISYAQLDSLVWRIATRLRRAGVGEGDMIGLSFASESASLAATLGAARIGATIVALALTDPRLVREQTARDARVGIVLGDRDDSPVAGLRYLPLDLSEVLSEALSDPAPHDPAPHDPAPHDPGAGVASPAAPWMLALGSGSTGTRKLIPLTHEVLLARMRIVQSTIPFRPRERVVFVSPVDFVITRQACLIVLACGGTIVFPERGTDGLVEICRSFDVRVVWAAVVHIERLLDAIPAQGPPVLDGLRVLRVASSLVSDDLRARIMRRVCPRLYVAYASNESWMATIAGPADHAGVPGTIGRAPEGVEVELVDAQGGLIDPGQVGRIRIRSPALIAGYRDDPKANAEAFRDGWFLPGDLGRFSPDGQLVYMGRVDQMMVMDGINIYPAEIEQAMCAHPEVADAAVVPLRSRIHQDFPVCAVALRGPGRAQSGELLDYALSRLGAKVPKRVVVLERIPRNELGKLDRAALYAAIGQSLAKPAELQLPPAQHHGPASEQPPAPEQFPLPQQRPTGAPPDASP